MSYQLSAKEILEPLKEEAEGGPDLPTEYASYWKQHVENCTGLEEGRRSKLISLLQGIIDEPHQPEKLLSKVAGVAASGLRLLASRDEQKESDCINVAVPCLTEDISPTIPPSTLNSHVNTKI